MEPTVQQSGLPAPNPSVAAPTAAPAEATAPQAPPVAAKPADVTGTRGSDSAASPVSAAAAASNEAQLAAAAQDAPAEAPAAEAPAELSLGEPSTKVQDKQVFQTGNEAFDQVAALLDSKEVPGYSDILVEAASGELSLASKAALVDSLGDTRSCPVHA